MLLPLRDRQTERSRRYHALLSPYVAHNAFNPSFQCLDGRLYLAFRHLGPSGRPPFVASVLVQDEGGGAPELIDLSALARACGVENVADPKLVRLGDELWATFNDGWSRERNRLFLMRLTPSPEQPLECVLGMRQAVEKNWSFFLEEGELKALYSLQPLRFLRAPWPPPASAADTGIRFQEHGTVGVVAAGAGLRLGIGTQALHVHDELWLVAHEKWQLGRRRAYVGRWARITGRGPQRRLSLSSTRLIHSARALLGSRPRYNPNLLSCTYFSGLMAYEGRVLLGYGINDVRFGFAEVEQSAL